ncbi:hypothetical protein ANN_23476 [Periplaneta americana]|uniref:Uncharacterized protein n=1 Tax=Periplaneta americana TaxID=6978 RepID=A0ABQ8SL71_PERAM|nr:hypothetical protein ANN_23476 [Periplaneta americana]
MQEVAGETHTRSSYHLAWSPNSPDLTTPDFFVWGFVKGIVYAQKLGNMLQRTWAEFITVMSCAGCAIGVHISSDVTLGAGIYLCFQEPKAEFGPKVKQTIEMETPFNLVVDASAIVKEDEYEEVRWDGIVYCFMARACVQIVVGRKNNICNIDNGWFDPVLWVEFGVAQWSERLVSRTKDPALDARGRRQGQENVLDLTSLLYGYVLPLGILASLRNGMLLFRSELHLIAALRSMDCGIEQSGKTFAVSPQCTGPQAYVCVRVYVYM